MAIAGEGLFYPQVTRGVRRTDDRHVADVIGDQLQPAKNEGGHEHLADPDVGLDESLHFFGTKFDNLASLAHPAAHQRAAPGKHVQFAGELSWSMLNNSELAVIGRLHDVQPPAGDQKERGNFSLLDQHFALSYFALAAHGRYAFDLRSRELGEHLLAAFRRKGWQLAQRSGSHKAGLDARGGIKDI